MLHSLTKLGHVPVPEPVAVAGGLVAAYKTTGPALYGQAGVTLRHGCLNNNWVG